MKTFPFLLLALSACVTHSDEFDATLYGYDAKADSIVGKAYNIRIDSVFLYLPPLPATLRHSVTVRTRGDDKLSLLAEKRLLLAAGDPRANSSCKSDTDCNGGETCFLEVCHSVRFTPDDIVSIGISPITKNVDLQFVMVDQSTSHDGPPALVMCGGRNLFAAVDLDFQLAEVTVDHARTYPFSECGIDDTLSTTAALFGLLAVPVATTDGKDFAGTYDYTYAISVH